MAEPRANGAPSRPRTDAVLAALGRAVLSVFYSEVEVIGQENLPAKGGAIVVGNHSNSLIDAVVMITALPRMPRFLAASTVWDNRPIIPLLNAAGVVPLFRRQDGRQDDGDITQSLTAAADLLGAGGILAVFPEGKSHNEAALLPMKSGTARIALEAERSHGPLHLQIIPVGMMFESKNVFRSRMLVEIGAPLDVDAAMGAGHDRRAARQITAHISKGLEAVTPNYDNWEAAHLIEHAADMWLQTRSELPGPSPIRDTAQMRKEFRTGYATLRNTHPEAIQSFADDLTGYIARLNDVGLRDDNIATAHHPGALRQMILGDLGAWAIRLPIACVGVLLNAVPFFILLRLSRRQDLDKRATWSVFAGLFLFPGFWCLAALICGAAVAALVSIPLGIFSAIGVLVAAPLTGLVAIKSGEARRRAWQNLRAWRVLRRDGQLWPELVRQRDGLLTQLSALWHTAFGKDT